ncbi:MORN repeat-containing protein [Besnoitia besnoiti]|uniref:MORN repeat-containing protein n=1 Tax=Besnoitia besnoiti TaxID=94643 RepID=A0A2A9MJ55_BESBE|nr:MORN repeat-containing protein [Besnoitia besnoiti]PFH35412.1 MORN repeat-containing protein [Besnoitia besnoiti]
MGAVVSTCHWADRCPELTRWVDRLCGFQPDKTLQAEVETQAEEISIPENAPAEGGSADGDPDESPDAYEAVIYEGGYKDGKRHGFGVLVRRCGSRYEGYFLDDAANGHGKFTHPSGDIYEGQWKYNKAHGVGKFIHADGSSYEGQWVEDVQEGLGREEWADGSLYEGTYKGGLKSGRGRFIWPDGSSYEGEFLENDIHGEGTYTWSDGKIYTGQWERNHMRGYGRMTFPDGRVHEGEYADDRKHGKGFMVWPDGRSVEHEWRDGKQVPGVGIIRDATNKALQDANDADPSRFRKTVSAGAPAATEAASASAAPAYDPRKTALAGGSQQGQGVSTKKSSKGREATGFRAFAKRSSLAAVARLTSLERSGSGKKRAAVASLFSSGRKKAGSA